MIRRVYSDLPKFKTLEFKEGLNILFADKSPGATDKHTRNRAGKSSFLEVVHFLLGSKCDKDSLFRTSALREATFGMEFDLGGAFARVERIGERASPLVVAGDFSRWPVPPTAKGTTSSITNDNWKAVLAKLMFNLDEFEGSWNPSFRSLISYFARRERSGGMAQPMMISQKQLTVDQQVNISFLVGLDWSVPREWQQVREREKGLEQIKKGMNDGTFGEVIGKASSLKSQLIVAHDRAKKLRAAVSSFKVLEQYHDYEREASQLTGELAKLADDNVIDRRYLSELESTTVEEIAPARSDLEELYKEAGILLPSLVKKRFEDVAAFHDSVVRNRRSYLQSEILATQERIKKRESQKAKIDGRRAEVLQVLQSTGALEQFSALQAELSKTDAIVEALKQKHDSADALETGNLSLKVERAKLVERLKRDYTEQSDAIEEAVLAFTEISSQLYETDKAGTLTITPTDNGPLFEPHISGEKSKGVNNMRIFCFDIMLMLLSLKKGRSPGFLIHDSHMFDGVDDRQIAKALALGAELAKKHGFQYIVTMNTDEIPAQFPAGFKIEDYAIKTRLTDASEDGGLFGFRFD